MAYVLILCIAVVLYFDFRVCYDYDPKLCLQAFALPRIIPLSFIFLSALIVIFSEGRWDELPVFILFFIPPFYILRRKRFIELAAARPATAESFEHEEERESSIQRTKKMFLVSDAYGVVIYWAFGVLALSFIVGTLTEFLGFGESAMIELIVTAFLSSVFLLVLIYNASKSISEKGFFRNVALHVSEESLWKIFIFPIMLGLVFAFISSSIIVDRPMQPPTPLGEVLEETESSAAVLIFLALAVLIAPFIEEIIFRGYFFRVISMVKGQRFAIYSIAVVFALMHVNQYWGDWLAIIMITILGFALTLLRAWSKTTVASVIAHYIYNGGVTVIPIIMLLTANSAYFKYKAYYPYFDTQTKEKLLIQSLEKEPDLAEAYNELAWLYSQENVKLIKALELIDKALSFAPDEVAYLDTKAEVLYKLQEIQRSVEIRKELLQRDVSGKMRQYLLDKLKEAERFF